MGNNRELPVKEIKFDPGIDMRDVYYKIAHYAFKDVKCPVLVPEQDLEDKLDYINVCSFGKKIGVVTRKGLGADTLVEILAGNCEGSTATYDVVDYPGLLSFFSFNAGTDMVAIYTLAFIIASNLNMRCPPIIMNVIDDGNTGTCYNDSVSGKTTWIKICEKESIPVIRK